MLSLDKRMRDLEANMERIVGLLETRGERAGAVEENQPLQELRETAVPGLQKVINIIHEELEDSFDVEFDHEADPGQLKIKVYVPTKYDRRVDAQKKMYPRDLRPIIAPIIGGEPYIREKCALIRTNIQSSIPTFKM